MSKVIEIMSANTVFNYFCKRKHGKSSNIHPSIYFCDNRLAKSAPSHVLSEIPSHSSAQYQFISAIISHRMWWKKIICFPSVLLRVNPNLFSIVATDYCGMCFVTRDRILWDVFLHFATREIIIWQTRVFPKISWHVVVFANKLFSE